MLRQLLVTKLPFLEISFETSSCAMDISSRGTVFALDRDEKRFRVLRSRCKEYGSGNVLLKVVCSFLDSLYSFRLLTNKSLCFRIHSCSTDSIGSFMQWKWDESYFISLILIIHSFIGRITSITRTSSISHSISTSMYSSCCSVSFGNTY